MGHPLKVGRHVVTPIATWSDRHQHFVFDIKPTTPAPRGRCALSMINHKGLILLNKPYGVLCQFRDNEGKITLKDYIKEPHFYAAGRLDADSEGLVVLTNDGKQQHLISDPRHKLPKTYMVQVEGQPDEKALQQLQNGLLLNDGPTKPALACLIREPTWLWPRNPPIRFRKNLPTQWIKITLREGRNRQVRRMTAKMGHPTLRLIRFSIGNWTINGLKPGESQWAELPKIPN